MHVCMYSCTWMWLKRYIRPAPPFYLCQSLSRESSPYPAFPNLQASLAFIRSYNHKTLGLSGFSLFLFPENALVYPARSAGCGCRGLRPVGDARPLRMTNRALLRDFLSSSLFFFFFFFAVLYRAGPAVACKRYAVTLHPPPGWGRNGFLSTSAGLHLVFRPWSSPSFNTSLPDPQLSESTSSVFNLPSSFSIFIRSEWSIYGPRSPGRLSSCRHLQTEAPTPIQPMNRRESNKP